MARYVVGDIQGCTPELESLLQQVAFNASYDELWCVGDLIGRGPDSLGSLTLIRELGSSARIVLGNHDLNLLAVLCDVRAANPKDKLEQILALPTKQKQELINWLVEQPLMISSHDNLVMSHAGIYPWWSLTQAQSYANEVSNALRDAAAEGSLGQFLQDMYGDEPAAWSENLRGSDRVRFIINALTRMRFCYPDGRLEFKTKASPAEVSAPLLPWYELREVSDATLVFGHWASLMGHTQRDDIIGLDTGCVWGEHLSALQWPSGRITQVAALTASR